MFSKPLASIGLAAGILGGLTAAVPVEPSRERPDGLRGGPYKVIAADFTGDRIPDLILSYEPSDALTVERGDGRGGFSRLAVFQIPYDHRPHLDPVFNLARGDLDGDGLPDLAIGLGGRGMRGVKTSFPGRVVIARNTGGGRFESKAEFPSESLAKGVALADLDNDGWLDLLYTARGSGYEGDTAVGKLYIRQGLGGWKFGPPLECEAGKSAYYVETGDLNNDGFLDILVPNEHADTVTYWINPGKALFTNPQKLPLARRTVRATPIPGLRPHGINDVRAADFDGDGKLDLVTANLGTSTVSVFRGNGDGTFQKDTILEGGKDGAFLAVGDLNGDGKLDFVLTHWTGDFLSVFINKGNGEFLPRKDYKTGLGNYGVALCDLNGDGKLDAVTANYRERSISVLLGVGDGTFRPAVTTPVGLRLQHGQWVADEK
jgi:hypothetical protein